MSVPIIDTPVAKRDDPITSYEAGESTKVRTVSHSTVMYLLATHGAATQEHIVNDARQMDVLASDSRIRSAFVELERKGFTERTGEYDTSGPRRKELWRLTVLGRKEALSAWPACSDYVAVSEQTDPYEVTEGEGWTVA